MKFTITTLNDNGSGMEFTKKEDFLREITMMVADCIENGGTFFDVQVDSDASCFAPENCKPNILESDDAPSLDVSENNPVSMLVRDCNGKRMTLTFTNISQILHWAEEEMIEDDEILLITQGNICIYSGLQADPTLALTADDITGFFA